MNRLERPTRNHRAWVFRLVQLSPVPVLVLTLVVWFSLPSTLATFALARSADQQSTPATRTSYFDEADRRAVLEQLNIGYGEEDSFESTIQRAWAAWVESLPLEPRTTDVREPTLHVGGQETFSGNMPFAAVDEWERINGALVWAWVVPGAPMPSVVASAVADTYALKAIREELRGQQANAEYSTEPPPQTIEELLWRYDGNRASILPPLDPNSLTLDGSGGMGSADYFLTGTLLKGSNGSYWRAVVVGTPEDPESMTNLEIPGLNEVDPAWPGISRRIKHLADSHSVDIWVFGPLEWEPVPLRVPAGKTAKDARRLAPVVWPQMLIDSNTSGDPLPQPLQYAPDTTGGSYGVVRATGLNNTPYFGGESYRYDEVPPQTVIWLAVWDEIPAPEKRSALEEAWLDWQRFDAAWFPTLFGACIGLLGLTLVASPVAFVAERRRATRERVRMEMARMRRDAHDKVYNRLSALSKRVAAAGEELAATNASTLMAVAEDIRSTVSELQEILGDETLHVNGALTTMPLRDQLQAVADAQARRLSITVRVESCGSVPEVDAGTGWDLQCIAEEALSNSARHGAAAHVRVVLAADDEGLVLTIADDGTGSSVLRPDDAPGQSTGLRGIRDRLAKRGGTVSIQANESGTTLTIRLPL